eukprot:TRINITY_DN1119_c0_g1_i8.p1 TRINITY_DN1119_c0_g1~~TRINITY_DN1119_c0_g1_i8.p1  ORF type:complete len:211 (-),score=7.62 TRINITY_DN1119_c0_g1_i8:291-923(-)
MPPVGGGGWLDGLAGETRSTRTPPARHAAARPRLLQRPLVVCGESGSGGAAPTRGGNPSRARERSCPPLPLGDTQVPRTQVGGANTSVAREHQSERNGGAAGGGDPASVTRTAGEWLVHAAPCAVRGSGQRDGARDMHGETRGNKMGKLCTCYGGVRPHAATEKNKKESTQSPTNRDGRLSRPRRQPAVGARKRASTKRDGQQTRETKHT